MAVKDRCCQGENIQQFKHHIPRVSNGSAGRVTGKQEEGEEAENSHGAELSNCTSVFLSADLFSSTHLCVFVTVCVENYDF